MGQRNRILCIILVDKYKLKSFTKVKMFVLWFGYKSNLEITSKRHRRKSCYNIENWFYISVSGLAWPLAWKIIRQWWSGYVHHHKRAVLLKWDIFVRHEIAHKNWNHPKPKIQVSKVSRVPPECTSLLIKTFNNIIVLKTIPTLLGLLIGLYLYNNNNISDDDAQTLYFYTIL